MCSEVLMHNFVLNAVSEFNSFAHVRLCVHLCESVYSLLCTEYTKLWQSGLRINFQEENNKIKLSDNASACVCCNLVIKYWHWFLQELTSVVKNRICGLWTRVCSVKVVMTATHSWQKYMRTDGGDVFLWNTATNSRCQNVLLAVAVASVFKKQKEERAKKRGRFNAQWFCCFLVEC